MRLDSRPGGMDFFHVSKLLLSDHFQIIVVAIWFRSTDSPGPPAILLCPYKPGSRRSPNLSSQKQTSEFRIMIGISNNRQNNIVRIIYINIWTLLRQQSSVHVGPSSFGFLLLLASSYYSTIAE